MLHAQGASRKPRFKPNIPTKPVVSSALLPLRCVVLAAMPAGAEMCDACEQIKQEGGQEAAGGSAATSEGGGVNQGGGRAPRDKSEGKDERGRSKAGRGV